MWNPQKLLNNSCRRYILKCDPWRTVMKYVPLSLFQAHSKGSRSKRVAFIGSSTISDSSANQEVKNVIEKIPQQGNGRKTKPYKKISDTLWTKVGKYALENGNAAASRKFSKEFDSPL